MAQSSPTNAADPEPLELLAHFLADFGLLSFLPSLEGTSLMRYNALLTASRPEFLRKLKEQGVHALGDRQKIANSMARARRNGLLPTLSTADLMRSLAEPVSEGRVRIPYRVPAQTKPTAPALQVPRVIYQTYRLRTVSTEMWENVCRIFELNPDWSYEFYDDERCAALISGEFGSRVSEAFARLRAGAAKADLWRYCVLYMYGGVYLDMDAGVNRALSHCIKPHTRFIPMYDAEANLIQWVLIAAPKQPLLRRCIEESTARILAGEPNIFVATGPTVLTDIFFELNPLTPGEHIYGSRTMGWGDKLARLQAAQALPEDSETFSVLYDGYTYAHLYERGESERYLPTWGRDPTQGLYWDTDTRNSG
ncbi:hypothetical protein AB1Y20_022525 [Prymnesium parvum]|uniref:Uncharacterized protein n=1 Tax=Prymnesium parvum TaxID=97485 RepID=A0AB34JJ99_PRYPA